MIYQLGERVRSRVLAIGTLGGGIGHVRAHPEGQFVSARDEGLRELSNCRDEAVDA